MAMAPVTRRASSALKTAIDSNSYQAVMDCLDEADSANFAHVFPDVTPSKDNCGYQRFSNGAVPPLHQAVFSCYKHSKDIGEAREYFQAEKILKLLLSRGADPRAVLTTSITLYKFEGYNWHHLKRNCTASDFALFLRGHLCGIDAYANVMGKRMDYIIMTLKQAREAEASTEKLPMSRVPTATLETWRALLGSEKFSDVQFITGEDTIYAHKCVLAVAAPYFATMIESGFAEGGASKIQTIHRPEIMRAVLALIYTGEVPLELLDEHTVELFAVSSEYQLESLTKLCTARIMQDLSVDSVKNILLLAQLHSCKDLKETCFSFIKRNAAKVLVQPAVMALASEDTVLWGELSEAISGSRPKPLSEATGSGSAKQPRRTTISKNDGTATSGKRRKAM